MKYATLTNNIENDSMHTSLRAQVQPFQTYTPQQIQEQLQHLHIQQQNELDSSAHAVAPRVTALLQQAPPQPPLDEQSLHCGKEATRNQESNTSVLHNLLSQSPKSVDTILNNPIGHNPTQRFLFHENVTVPRSASKQHQQSQEAASIPSDLSFMMTNIVSCTDHDVPSFPVSMQIYEDSPTKGLGQHNPIEDYPMSSIAEGTNEDITESTIQQSVSSNLAEHALPNGIGRVSEQVSGATRGISPTGSKMLLSASNEEVAHRHPFPWQHGDHMNMPSSSVVSNSQSILNRVSTVLNNSRIQHYRSNGGFVVEHDGVKLLIACTPSHPNTVHLQFIAGDPIEYQTLSSHLASQLQ